MTHDLSAAIRARARPVNGSPPGTPPVVGDGDLEELARRFCCPLLRIQVAALEAGVVPARYLRNLGAFGLAGQLRLLSSRAAVVGLGGAGGLATEILARSGVGTLVLVDGDSFEETNLNRQVLATSATLGLPKPVAARDRLRQVNPGVEVIPVGERLTPDNGPAILAGCHVVLDCLDSGRDRLVLQAACRQLKLPLVHAALSGWRGRVATIGTEGPDLESFYRTHRAPSPQEVFSLGAPAPAVALLAAWQAAQALKVLLGQRPAEGVFTFDLASGQVACVPFWVARLSARWRPARRVSPRTGRAT